MSSAVTTLPVPKELQKEISLRRRHVTVLHVPMSSMPYRVEKKRTGVHLASLETPEKVVEFLLQCCPDELAKKPATRRSSR